jgi:2-dehydropantoate 2-reductase
MRLAMMGSGGVGGYFGARLAQAGQEVTFIARGAHAEAMRRQGLRVQSGSGDFQVQPVRVVEDPAQAGTVDAVILAVKLWDSETAARAIVPMVGPATTVVSLQNGIAKDELLARAVGREHVIGGVTHVAAVIAEPGVIRHTGTLQRVTLGELDGSTSARVEALVAVFRAGGVDATASPDIRSATWEKFVFLTAVSGMTALTRSPIGPIREHPRTRSMLIDALRETVAVARAEAVALPDSVVDKLVAQIDALAPQMLSSMAQDLLRGRRLELEFLSGTVARLGEKHALAVPAHRAIEAALILHAQGA